MSHTLLVGGEYIDTENENHRFNSQWSTSGSDKETFALPAMDHGSTLLPIQQMLLRQ